MSANGKAIEMEIGKFSQRIGELQDALIGQGQKGMAAEVVDDSARSFLSRVISLTPPKSRTQGEHAIDRDVAKVFTQVDAGLMQEIGEKHGLTDVNAWFTTNTGRKAQVTWDKIDPSGDGMREFHLKHLRNSRSSDGWTHNLKRERSQGAGWYAAYVVTPEAYVEFVATLKAKVGTMKASWAVSAPLGMKVAKWIRDQIPKAKGSCVNKLDSPSRPRITITNAAPGVRDQERAVIAALRYTGNAMKRQMELVAKGLAGDFRKGSKFKNRGAITGRLLEVYPGVE